MMPPSTLPLLRRSAPNCHHSMKYIGTIRKHKGTCCRALHAASTGTSNGQATQTRTFRHISSINLPDTDGRIRQRYSSSTTQSNSNQSSTDVLIIGGGVAGICTAHYLLRQSSTITVRLIDELPGVAQATSRINGGLICPSLSNSWTNMPIFAGKDAIARMAVRQLLGSGSDSGGASLLKFDPKLMLDARFWTFFLQWVRRKPYLGEQHKVISALMHHSMDCFNDASDDIMQSLEYSRTAIGTKTHDGRLGEKDSSGDIGLFGVGLHERLVEAHGDRYLFTFNAATHSLEVSNGKVGSLNAIQGSSTQTFEADQYVIAAGNKSYDLCTDLGVPCPILPCKGYIIVFRSNIQVSTNIELRNKAFVAPFGDGKYHLSGFAEFTADYNNTQKAMNIDKDRADALIKVAKEIFPDMEVDSVHVGYRPLSPDDTPLIGPTKYSNLFLNTGGGSKGWSQGPGSGQLLAGIMLGTDTKIDSAPYSPRRFELFR